MTAPEILYSVILCLLTAVFSLFAVNSKRDAAALFAFLQISWWGRWAFNYLNFSLSLFTQKDASEFSLRMLDQPNGIWAFFDNGFFGAFLTLKFFIQAFVNIPALRLFEESIYVLNLTNGFVGAMSGLLVFFYFRRLFDIRVATIGLLLVSAYPAAVAFSFFALRDIFMYFFTLLNICSITWLYLRRDHAALNWFLYLFSAFSDILCRTQLILFLMVIPGWIIMLWGFGQVGKIRNRAQRMFVTACLAIVIPSIGLACLFGAYMLAIRKLGYTSFVSPFDLMSNYASNRASRGLTPDTEVNVLDGSGHGSDVLPPSVYSRTPVPLRVMIQIFGMWCVPMPWLLTSVSRLFAFSDSIFVMLLTVWAWRQRRLSKLALAGRFSMPASVLQYDQKRFNSLMFAGLLTFILSMIAFGLVVSNGGNAFRMRLCTVPYAIMGASVYLAATYVWVKGRFESLRSYRHRMRQASETPEPATV